MRYLIQLFSFILLLLPAAVHAQTSGQPDGKNPKPQYDYETVPGDPLGVKIYTLDNGLKLYMSVNKKEPRIYTNIAVRAGSKHDPADATGLAHYLEHMLFKGTENIGALDWEKEKIFLNTIKLEYEKHRKTEDAEERKQIYNKIDRLSNEASKYVAANEYDRLVAAMGATGSNAYTWVEQTVYINDIPANETERWMKLESERFSQLVLRLFHTELEAVYEEFNISQDNDFRKVFKVIAGTLFPTHPYGTQTTIGTGEHLKNPSHVKIHDYFDTYYVPNNMAIVLAGDFDPDKVVSLAEKYFGNYQDRYIPPFTHDPQPPLQEVVRKEVFGQESEWVEIAWRFGGAGTEDPLMLQLIDGLLNNGQAGLVDINLAQKQKTLSASSWVRPYADYSMMGMKGEPREGQSLEEVEQLLLEQIDKLKNGEFEDWLISAVIKYLKLRDIRANESNRSRAGAMTNAFIQGIDWNSYVNRFRRMSMIQKSDVIAFAQKHFKDNYVVVYKRTGEDKGVYKVEKPKITPVQLNREMKSEYAAQLLSEETPSLQPAFVDFKQAIQTSTLDSDVELDYIKNSNNETFQLYYILDMGSHSDRKLAMAVNYLPFLGTNRYSPEQLIQEFFKLGLDFDVNTSDDQVYVTLSGLDESFESGVHLLEHILANVQPNEEALDNMVSDILSERENRKKDKRSILRGAMANYARYGKVSPYTDILSEEELKKLTAEELANIIRSLLDYEHRIFYYGSKPAGKVSELLDRHHKVSSRLKPVIPAKEYPELETSENKVYFVSFPMVQAEVLLLSNGTDQFDLDEFIMSELYNNYFGYGLSSIVFQEIRESKGLAYSAYAYYSSPSKKDRDHYLQAYVGTQVDKLREAVPAMMEIIENMPMAPEQIETARQSVLKQLETQRLTGASVYWNYRNTKDKGFERDLRQDLYQKMQTVNPEELQAFQKKHVKGRNYTILVLGNKEEVDMDYLNTLGPVKELALEEIFGY